MSLSLRGRRPVATRLRNSSNFDMNVDGSSTPQEFKFDAPSNESAIITELDLLLEDNTAIDYGNRFMGYGASSVLTNGIVIESTSDGQLLNIITIKTTRDLLRFASPGGYAYEFGAAFRYVVKASRIFGDGLLMRRGSSDHISVTVNDDLTGLTFFQATAYGFRV